MRTLAILAALAVSVNSAHAAVSTTISVDPENKRIYAVFYETDACNERSAWDCAYMAMVCYIPEHRIGAVLMHVRPDTIQNIYYPGSISIDKRPAEPLVMVKPVRDTATSWVVSTVVPKEVTESLSVSLLNAYSINITMGDYTRSVMINDAGRADLSRVTKACS